MWGSDLPRGLPDWEIHDKANHASSRFSKDRDAHTFITSSGRTVNTTPHVQRIDSEVLSEMVMTLVAPCKFTFYTKVCYDNVSIIENLLLSIHGSPRLASHMFAKHNARTFVESQCRSTSIGGQYRTLLNQEMPPRSDSLNAPLLLHATLGLTIIQAGVQWVSIVPRSLILFPWFLCYDQR